MRWLMWRNGKQKVSSPKRRGRLGGFLDDGSEIEGKYTCSGTVMLDAKVTGELTARDTLIIGERAVVRATVRASTLIVRGELVGNVTAERVELKRGARVTGDVEAPVILMEEGALHDGHCRMAKAAHEAPLSLVVPIKG